MAARMTRKTVREQIREHHGNLTAVADALGRSRQTVYNYIKRYDLQSDVESARDSIFDHAEQNLFKAVKEGNIDVSKFVVTRMPSSRKWSSKSEVESEFKHTFDIPDDIAEQLRQMGVEPDDVASEFFKLIREQANNDATEQS